MIKYVIGDLFDHIPQNKQIIICHITNNIGAWGSGFVVPLGQCFPEARRQYLLFPQQLGETQFVKCGNVIVANMCAQSGIMSHSTGDREYVNEKPIRYAALANCLIQVKDYAMKKCDLDVEIYAPAFGSDRAGGDWYIISELLNEIINYNVTIFSLTKQAQNLLLERIEL